jgi:hypothetical protein
MLIAFASGRERPGVSQHIAPHLDEVGHLAAAVGFVLCPAVGRRHDDAPFGSGGSLALVTDSGRVRCGDTRSWPGFALSQWSILLILRNRKRPRWSASERGVAVAHCLTFLTPVKWPWSRGPGAARAAGRARMYSELHSFERLKLLLCLAPARLTALGLKHSQC